MDTPDKGGTRPSYERLVDDRERVRYDLRGMGPTRECLCGSDLWRVLGRFDEDGDLSFYFLDVICAECGSIAKAVTPERGIVADGDDDGEVGCG